LSWAITAIFNLLFFFIKKGYKGSLLFYPLFQRTLVN
jgi:hypothetical protein